MCFTPMGVLDTAAFIREIEGHPLLHSLEQEATLSLPKGMSISIWTRGACQGTVERHSHRVMTIGCKVPLIIARQPERTR
jgi:hypothetical protein